MAEVNKPVSVVLKEAENSIRKAVGETNLLPCLLEPILREIHSELKQSAEQQYAIEKANYEKKLKEQEESEHVNE